MAKKSKKRNSQQRGAVPNRSACKESSQGKQSSSRSTPGHHALRETIESLAIAFILAFFIRTFVAEAFVIPTGSMSPTLMGIHKDLECPQCGERFKINASQRGQTSAEKAPQECLAGMCPMCRYTVPVNRLAAKAFDDSPKLALNVPSYSGDRIVVNKFLYSFSEPNRWDVVVFKYPGQATDNYIKRMVGLPKETIRIYQGDLYVRRDASSNDKADLPFSIERKPAHTIRMMRQIVHDTNRDPSVLHKAGWPLRWQKEDGNTAWEIEADASETNVQQQYVTSDPSAKGEATKASDISWLRYQHTPPTGDLWAGLEVTEKLIDKERPKLIGDFNSYNTRLVYKNLGGRPNPYRVPATSQGLHWVGDLLVEVDVDLRKSSGELLLELVEAGHRFRCRCNLATGKATLEIVPHGDATPTDQFTASASTPLKGKGKHRLLFANVDDSLHLWVDDQLVKFDNPSSYDWGKLFGSREKATPKTSAESLGDLAPVGIGTQGADLAIDRLQVWRDIYYIADRRDPEDRPTSNLVTDYPSYPPDDLLFDSEKWPRFFGERRSVEFHLAKDQFFVMGDNSPWSQDARLWNFFSNRDPRNPISKPGGSYLERRLLIGRAISVVWPHTWNYVIPGFGDMRRIQ